MPSCFDTLSLRYEDAEPSVPGSGSQGESAQHHFLILITIGKPKPRNGRERKKSASDPKYKQNSLSFICVSRYTEKNSLRLRPDDT